LKSIKIGLPPWPYLRQLYVSFVKLIELDYADINFIQDGLEIVARGPDVRAVLSKAFKYAAELGADYRQRGFNNAFPLSGNDAKGPWVKLLQELELPREASVEQLLTKYSDTIRDVEPGELQRALYPYTTEGDLAPLQVLLLEFYALTRGPFFDGFYELKLRMNLHQLLLCIAGYVAARHVRVLVDRKSRKAPKFAAVLMLPMGLGITRYDFYRNLRNNIERLPGLKPDEAVILWVALKVPEDFPEDIMVLAIEEPGGPNQASPVSSIPVHITEMRARAGDALKRLRHSREVYELLHAALSRGTAMAGRKPEIDDATEYAKLLFLALQGFERERLELELRAARREAATSLALSDRAARERHRLAQIARKVAQELITSRSSFS
jgi:hypothetical protein